LLTQARKVAVSWIDPLGDMEIGTGTETDILASRRPNCKTRQTMSCGSRIKRIAAKIVRTKRKELNYEIPKVRNLEREERDRISFSVSDYIGFSFFRDFVIPPYSKSFTCGCPFSGFVVE